MRICHDYVDKAVNTIEQHATGILEKIRKGNNKGKVQHPHFITCIGCSRSDLAHYATDKC